VADLRDSAWPDEIRSGGTAMLNPQLWVGTWNLVDFPPKSTQWGRLEIAYRPPMQGKKESYDPAGGLRGAFVSGTQRTELKKLWAFSVPPSPGKCLLSAELEFPDGGHTVVVLRLDVRRDEITGADVANQFWGSYLYNKAPGQFFPDPWLGIRIVDSHP
jgi:hypothetical protein